MSCSGGRGGGDVLTLGRVSWGGDDHAPVVAAGRSALATGAMGLVDTRHV